MMLSNLMMLMNGFEDEDFQYESLGFFAVPVKPSGMPPLRGDVLVNIS